jgi:hypothetical protein
MASVGVYVVQVNDNNLNDYNLNDANFCAVDIYVVAAKMAPWKK